MTTHLYQVQVQIISTRAEHVRDRRKHDIASGFGKLRCSVSVPTFFVEAYCADEAITKAQLVLCADHRDTDNRQIEIFGTVIRRDDRGDYQAFEYRRPDTMEQLP